MNATLYIASTAVRIDLLFTATSLKLKHIVRAARIIYNRLKPTGLIESWLVLRHLENLLHGGSARLRLLWGRVLAASKRAHGGKATFTLYSLVT